MAEFVYQLNVSSDSGSQFERMNHTKYYEDVCHENEECRLRYKGMIRIVFFF